MKFRFYAVVIIVGLGVTLASCVSARDFIIRNAATSAAYFKVDGTLGYVGMATSTPSYQLDVVGTSRFSQPVIVGTPTATTHATTKSYVDSMFTGSGQWTTSGTNIYSTLAGNVGIGSTSPTNKFVVDVANAATSNVNYAVYGKIAGAPAFTVAGGNFNSISTGSGTGGSSSFGVIGSATGAAASNVGGSFLASGGTSYNTQLLVGTSAAPTDSYSIYSAGSAKSYFNGSVGIGTTSPGVKLDVVGGASSYGTNIYGNWTPDGSSLVKNWLLNDGSSNWTLGSATIQTVTDGKIGNKVIRSATGAESDIASTGWIPIDPSKTYKISLWARSAGTVSPDCTYFSGRQADKDLTYPWGNGGWGQPYFIACATIPTSWTYYERTIGPNGVSSFQSGAQYFQVGALLNYAPAENGYVEVQGFRFEELPKGLDIITTSLRVTGSGPHYIIDGNIGIATTTPSYKLDFVGTSQFSQPVIVGTPTNVSHAATKNYVDSMFTGSGQWTTSGTNIYSTLAGNVGVGTAIPAQRLDVTGVIRSSASNIGTLNLGANTVGDNIAGQIKATYSSSYGYTGKLSFNVLTNGVGTDYGPTEEMYLEVVSADTKAGKLVILPFGGNVGIGTTGPLNKLQVEGSIALASAYNGMGNGVERFIGVPYSGATWAGAGSFIGFAQGGTGGVSNDIRFYTHESGVSAGERVRITSVGNVGIGTTSPNTKLAVATNKSPEAGVTNAIISNGLELSGSYPLFDFKVTNGSLWRFQSSQTNNDFYLQESTTPRITLQSGGNIGIATTTPSYKLDVVGTSQFSQPVIVGTPTATTHATTKSYVDSMFTGSGQWTTSGTNIYSTLAGNVGIGTTAPSQKLHVSTNEVSTAFKGIVVENLAGGNSDASRAGIAFKAYDWVQSAIWHGRNISGVNGGALVFGTNPDTVDLTVGGVVGRMVITNAGNVGIGLTNPSQKLEVAGNIYVSGTGYIQAGTAFMQAGTTKAIFGSNSGATPILITRNGADNGNDLFINASGNVGIATTTPSYKLDVVGTSQFSQPVIVGTPTATTHATTKSYVDSMFTGSGQWTTSGTNIYSTLAGNVGIGTTNPNMSGTTTKFGVAQTDGSTGLLIGNTSGVGRFALNGEGDGSWSMYDFAAGSWIKGIVQRSGNVGIGTTSADARLEIEASAGTQLRLQTSDYHGSSNQYATIGFSASGANSLNFNTYYVGDGNAITFNPGNVEVMRVIKSGSAGNVGIATSTPSYTLTVNGGGWFNQPIFVGTPTNASHAATKSYVDSIVGGGAGTGSFATLSVTGTSTLSGNWQLGGAALGNVNMNGYNLLAVNKITAVMIDPLYQIDGENYSTFGVSTAGAVYEEYIGRGKLTASISNSKFQILNKLSNESNVQNSRPNDQGDLVRQAENKSSIKIQNLKLNNSEPTQYEYIIDFSKVEKGSDLWLWYNVVDFGDETVNAIATSLKVPANIYYEIKDSRIIFHASLTPNTYTLAPSEIEFSYRLSGKRHDWKEWPTRAKNQKETPSFILQSK